MAAITIPSMKLAHFQFDPQQDLLGEGPLSEVYRAQDTKLGRTVALKILRSHAEIDPEADRRFLREAVHTSGFAHENIATVFEYGVRFAGTAAVTSYTLRIRGFDQGERLLSISDETRVFEERDQGWICVHVHKSPHGIDEDED